MKRITIALAAATALSLVVGQPASANDDDDIFAPITECGTVIIYPGHYKLMNDLVGCDIPDPLGKPIEYGIGIASSDVVLDLGGHTISCLQGDEQNHFLFNFGIFSEPFLAEIRIQNGTIMGCGLGANLNQSFESTIMNMVFKANGTGIEVLGGSRNQVKRNSVLGNWYSGVVTTSFLDGGFVGPGTSHKIHKNLVLFSGQAGIEAAGIADTVVSCNRTDRNFDGIVLIDTGRGNDIRKNVANDNVSTGIGLFGFDFPPFFVAPIPEGNTISKNVAFDNGDFDLGELALGFGGPVTGTECLNSWNRNGYDTQFALEGCIPPPTNTKGDDCAPSMRSFDFGDDENLLRDPSFELRLTPGEGGWLMFGASWFSFDQARSGHQSMFNGAAGSVSGSFVEFPADPDSQWRLTGYGLTAVPLIGSPSFGIVQVSFFDEFGNDLGTVETVPGLAKISNFVDETSPAAEWIFLDTGTATAPPNTATIQAFTLFVDFSGAGFQGVFFDDLKLCTLDDSGDCKEVDDN